MDLITCPSDYEQVILYYGAEKDILDFEKDYKLWVEDGKTTSQQITFGKKIAACIESVVYGNYDYGYVCIGIVKDKTGCRFIGIDRHINMDNIIQSVLIVIEKYSFLTIKVMKTVHNRNECETVLYHVCIWIK